MELARLKVDGQFGVAAEHDGQVKGPQLVLLVHLAQRFQGTILSEVLLFLRTTATGNVCGRSVRLQSLPPFVLVPILLGGAVLKLGEFSPSLWIPLVSHTSSLQLSCWPSLWTTK